MSCRGRVSAGREGGWAGADTPPRLSPEPRGTWPARKGPPLAGTRGGAPCVRSALLSDAAPESGFQGRLFEGNSWV